MHIAGLNAKYREANKGLYVVARNFFLLLLNCSAWVLLSKTQTFISPSVVLLYYSLHQRDHSNLIGQNGPFAAS